MIQYLSGQNSGCLRLCNGNWFDRLLQFWSEMSLIKMIIRQQLHSQGNHNFFLLYWIKITVPIDFNAIWDIKFVDVLTLKTANEKSTRESSYVFKHECFDVIEFILHLGWLRWPELIWLMKRRDESIWQKMFKCQSNQITTNFALFWV